MFFFFIQKAEVNTKKGRPHTAIIIFCAACERVNSFDTDERFVGDLLLKKLPME